MHTTSGSIELYANPDNVGEVLLSSFSASYETMKRHTTRVLTGIAAIGIVAWVFCALLVMRPSLVHSQVAIEAVQGIPAETAKVKLPELVIPDTENLKVPTEILIAGDLLEDTDSIYVTEVTVSGNSVVLTDETGRKRVFSTTDMTPLPPDAFVPRPRHPGSRRNDVIHVFADVVTIEKDEVIEGDVVCVLGGNVEVLGAVHGSVFSLLGRVRVEGTIDGSAIAPFGRVSIGSNARVGGDVVASDIIKEPGGRIGGTRNEIFLDVLGPDWAASGDHWVRTTITVVGIIKIIFSIFLVLLTHALAAKNVAKVKNRIQASFFKSFLMGVLVQILLLPVILLLIVTIIGIPLAVFMLPLMMVGAVILSLAAFGLFVGEKIDENTNLPLQSTLARTLVGLMALQSVPLLAIAAMWGSAPESWGGPLKVVALGLFGLSTILGYVVLTIGTGAVTTTRFGTRPKDPIPVDSDSADSSNDEPGSETSGHPGPTPLPSRRSDTPGTAPAVN